MNARSPKPKRGPAKKEATRVAAVAAAAPHVDLAATPAPTVAQLLAASRHHHQTKHKFANRKVNGQPAPDYKAAEAEIALALEKRLQAHDLDAGHVDPAWSLDAASHDDLVTFYRLYPDIL